MSSAPDQKNDSPFTNPPVKFKVGCNGKIYYVHPGVLIPFSSSALYARIHGSWKGVNDDIVDLTEYDEQTIESAISFFYTRDYHPVQPSPGKDEESSKTNNEGLESTELHKSRSESSLDGTSLEQPSETNPPTRPLTPIQDIIGSDPRTGPQGAATPIDSSGKNDQDLVSFGILAHAKVFAFAHKFLISELEAFAKYRLAQGLDSLDRECVGMSSHMAEAVRVIYCSTPNVPQNDARRLLSQFTALRFTTLSGSHLDDLMAEIDEFTVNVSHKLARRMKDMESRMLSLESKRLRLEKDLKSSQREVEDWKSFNRRLPSSKRRWGIELEPAEPEPLYE